MKLNKGWGVASIILGCVVLLSAANNFFQPAEYIGRQMEEFGENMDDFGQTVDQFANDYQSFDQWYEREALTQRDSLAWPAQGIKKVHLDNQVGRVTVIGSKEAKEITVQTTKRLRLNKSEEETRRYFSDIKINTREMEHALRIETEMPQHLKLGFNRLAAVDYEITVPAGMELEIVNHVGEVIVHDLESALTADLNVGRIDVNGYKGKLQLKNNTGEIVARGGTEIKNIDIRSNVGAVAVYLPSDANLLVDAETNIGNVESDFSELKVDLRVPGKEADGKLGTGSGNLTVRTNTGEIELRKE